MADMETIARLLSQTWPGRAVQSAITGLKAPGNAYASTPENPVTTEQMIAPAADLAGLMTGFPGSPAGSLGSGVVRPYQNLPDSLMGFRRNGPNKGFHEDNFKYEVPVRVDFGNGNVFEDAIKGLNKSHALERAHRNWPDAKIQPIE